MSKPEPGGFMAALQAAREQERARAEEWLGYIDEARRQLGLPPREAQPARRPRPEVQIRATATHYAVTVRGLGLMDAAKRMRINHKTYRDYRIRGWLLAPADFEAQAGVSLEEYFDWSGQN